MSYTRTEMLDIATHLHCAEVLWECAAYSLTDDEEQRNGWIKRATERLGEALAIIKAKEPK